MKSKIVTEGSRMERTARMLSLIAGHCQALERHPPCQVVLNVLMLMLMLMLMLIRSVTCTGNSE